MKKSLKRIFVSDQNKQPKKKTKPKDLPGSDRLLWFAWLTPQLMALLWEVGESLAYEDSTILSLGVAFEVMAAPGSTRQMLLHCEHAFPAGEDRPLPPQSLLSGTLIQRWKQAGLPPAGGRSNFM